MVARPRGPWNQGAHVLGWLAFTGPGPVPASPSHPWSPALSAQGRGFSSQQGLRCAGGPEHQSSWVLRELSPLPLKRKRLHPPAAPGRAPGRGFPPNRSSSAPPAERVLSACAAASASCMRFLYSIFLASFVLVCRGVGATQRLRDLSVTIVQACLVSRVWPHPDHYHQPVPCGSQDVPKSAQKVPSVPLAHGTVPASSHKSLGRRDCRARSGAALAAWLLSVTWRVVEPALWPGLLGGGPANSKTRSCLYPARSCPAPQVGGEDSRFLTLAADEDSTAWVVRPGH